MVAANTGGSSRSWLGTVREVFSTWLRSMLRIAGIERGRSFRPWTLKVPLLQPSLDLCATSAVASVAPESTALSQSIR